MPVTVSEPVGPFDVRSGRIPCTVSYLDSTVCAHAGGTIHIDEDGSPCSSLRCMGTGAALLGDDSK